MAYTDDFQFAPENLDADAIGDYTTVRDDPPNARIDISAWKSLMLPPQKQYITSAELDLLVGAEFSVAPDLGKMKMVGVSIEYDGYIRENIRKAIVRAEMASFTRRIAAMDDKQVGLILYSMLLAPHTSYLERKVTPDLGK